VDMTEEVPSSDLYPYVYEFLKSAGLQKTRKLFRQESNYDVKSHVPPAKSIYDIYKFFFLISSEGVENDHKPKKSKKRKK